MMRSVRFVAPLLLLHGAAALAQEKPGMDSRLEQVFGDPKYQLTGVAVSATGRLFVNYPVWSPVHEYCVVEVLPGGQVKPYPDEAMNDWKAGDDGTKKWVSVQAVYIDDQDKLWVVDPAAPSFGEVYRDSNKLVRIDLATNKVERAYRMTGVLDKGSYINDVRVDTGRQFAYMTESTQGGIVVVDLESGKARLALHARRSCSRIRPIASPSAAVKSPSAGSRSRSTRTASPSPPTANGSISSH